MRVCFLCSTPYQVFSAINIKNCNFLSDTADVYVYDYFKDSENLTAKLEKSELFNRVRNCKYRDIHSQLVNGGRIQTLYKKVKFYKWNKSAILQSIDNSKYDAVFYSNQDPINEIIITYLFAKNRSIRICHFEDGWVDYVFPYKYFYGEKTQKSNQLWKTPVDYFTRENSFMYKPELAEAYKYNDSIRKIIIESNYTLSFTNPVFGYENDAAINASVLYFDTLAENRLGITEEEHLKTLKCCCDRISQEKIIVKKHPRNFGNFYEENGYYVYKHQTIPFEVICANQNFANCLLISSFSTACFSPNVLFGQEPFVILTFKLAGIESEMDKRTHDYLNRIYENYSDKEKIMIPETYEQLEQCIDLYIRYMNNEKS